MTLSSRTAATHCSMFAIVVALVAASCGGSSGDVGTGPPESPAAASSEADENTSAGPNTEPEAEADSMAEPAAVPASGGVSSAVLVLDGVEHVFTDFAQCLTFAGLPVMSVIARNEAGDQLQLSYEETGAFGEDDEDTQYSNTIQYEPADGNSSWRTGSVTGLSPSDDGALEWSLTGSTITGAGEFTNIFDADSPVVPGTIDATCVE